MVLFWALIALKVVGDLDGEQPFDSFYQNYNSLQTSFTILYALTSPDFYPDVMLPAYNTS